MNETTILAGIVAAVVTVLTKIIDALVARRRDAQSGSLEHRKLLSDDEKAFRQAVLDEVKELRDELEKKGEQLDGMRMKLAEAQFASNDSARKCAEAERRAVLLEAQLDEIRNLHKRIRRMEGTGISDHDG